MDLLSREKHPLQKLHSKNGGGHIFEGLRYMFNNGKRIPAHVPIFVGHVCCTVLP